jgi:hypothetical protein
MGAVRAIAAPLRMLVRRLAPLARACVGMAQRVAERSGDAIGAAARAARRLSTSITDTTSALRLTARGRIAEARSMLAAVRRAARRRPPP